MDCCQAIAGYLTKMVTAGDSSTGSSSAKMKILLLDSETVRVYTEALHCRGTNDSLGIHSFNGNHTVRSTKPRSLLD